MPGVTLTSSQNELKKKRKLRIMSAFLVGKEGAAMAMAC